MLSASRRAWRLMSRHSTAQRQAYFSSQLGVGSSFLNGSNAFYVDEMYKSWRADPSSVHSSWRAYFSALEGGQDPATAFAPAPSPGQAAPAGGFAPAAGGDSFGSSERMGVAMLVRAYQVRGHLAATLDPLGLKPAVEHPDLDPATYGFTEADMDRELDMGGVHTMGGFLGIPHRATLRQLVQRLRDAYCGNLAVEYMHIQDREKCNWIRERLEVAEQPKFDKEDKMHTLDRLVYADTFETFLANKYNTAKRFGVEGAESLIPGLKAMIDRSVQLGVSNVVFGMPHRGRLNVLTNVIRKPLEMVFREFQGTHVDLDAYERSIAEGDWSGSGDVKYHLGTSYDRTYPDGKTVHLALVANPSHLEAVNPVVEGKARAKQDLQGDESGKGTLPVLMHGDAAFAGQGVVYETMQMMGLRHFSTGGTVHVVVNNQVGFTTEPTDSRSTRYCSDIAKTFDCPIFHVNGDDPEAVVRAFRCAAEWRQEFGTDVVVDLIGYRRHGHNELDQPSFTQPLMYDAIKAHPSTLQLYKERLIQEGSLTPQEVESLQAAADKTFQAAFDAAKDYHGSQKDWLSSRWKGFFDPHTRSNIRNTGVAVDTLQRIAAQLTHLPEGFKLHPNLARIMKAKAKTLQEGAGLDWATGEALAFGSLMLEGNRVRMSGQDAERGTFSHRHAVLHNQADNSEYMPLAHLGEDAAPITIANSLLSEYAVLGFEMGYSLESPNQLNIWEAQFGDFVNGAQIIIDQFLSSGEAKWYRQSGLVMLLPHGFDGQGPEHSSCRIERFLQAVDEDEDKVPAMGEDERVHLQHTNVQVANVTTPANYFHLLRRQIHRDFRKPLVVASPKALLRHKKAVSSFEDMQEGTQFMRVIPDDDAMCPSSASAEPEKVRRLVLCSGKVYYDLERAREETGTGDVALTRVEQLAPFPWDLVATEMRKYPNAEVVWAQEEPQNMGAWSYILPRLMTVAREVGKDQVMPRYIGREPAAAPATGSVSIHEMEQEKLVHEALAE